MKRIYYVLFALGLTLSFTTQAEETTPSKPSFTRLDKIVAIVNREIITQSEIDKEMQDARTHLERTNQPVPTDGELRKLVLENLISKNIEMQLARAKGVKATKEEVDQAVSNVAKANRISLEQLKTALQQTGINFDKYQSQIRDQIVLQKLQQEEVARNVVLKPEDVTKFMRENRDKLSQYNAYHVIDIVMPTPDTSPNQLAVVKKRAGEMIQQLQNGKDMEAVIHQYPSVEKNDLGWRALGEFPSLFQSKVAVMKINNVSAPIQAPNGFHILKLVDAKGDNVKPTGNDLKNAAFQHKVSEAVKEWLQKLRSEAYVKIMN